MIRVALALPGAYIASFRAAGRTQQDLVDDVKRRLRKMGAHDVFLVVQDPTNEQRASALTDRRVRDTDNVLRVVGSEVVSAPAVTTSSNVLARNMLPRLDPGLTPAEAVAVSHALERETNPRHLAGFAGTFEPHYPVAASLLRARAFEVEPDTERTPAPLHRDVAVGCDAIGRMRVGAIERFGAMGMPADVGLGEVRRVACTYVSTGAPLAPLRQFPVEISGLAAACIRPSRTGARLVDRAALEAASPSPADAGYVSPAALQLAMAGAKPGSARVWNQGIVGAVFAGLDAPGSTPAERFQQLRAKLAVEKADKTLQRQRWVRWYERVDA